MPDFRSLPAVDHLAAELDAPHALAVHAARATIEERRDELRAGATDDPDLLARARERVERAKQPSLRRVLNATGVIVHTNLGRAPLAAAAREAVTEPPRATPPSSGTPTPAPAARATTTSRRLLTELTGAEAALAVNNGAAAVLLAAAALAGPGHEIVVSRGQLVEIGGGFRIPDVVAQAGARSRRSAPPTARAAPTTRGRSPTAPARSCARTRRTSASSASSRRSRSRSCASSACR